MPRIVRGLAYIICCLVFKTYTTIMQSWNKGKRLNLLGKTHIDYEQPQLELNVSNLPLNGKIKEQMMGDRNCKP